MNNFVQRHLSALYVVIMFTMSMLIRYGGRNFKSEDYIYFLEKWYAIIQSLGEDALHTQVGDYNLPYQSLVYLFTQFPVVNDLYAYKAVSVIFDVLLAMISTLFYMKLFNGKKENGIQLFFVVLNLPTVILNSAYWAQCDSIYVTFLMLTLYGLFLGKYGVAFFCYGIAFSFKLQAVFILPFVIAFYFKSRRFSLKQSIWFFAGLYTLCLPAISSGRSWLDPIRIYLQQTAECLNMYANFPSVWAILSNNYEVWSKFGILFTIIVLGWGTYELMRKEISEDMAASDWMPYLLWYVWTIILFLPAMHERYGYLLDILLCIGTFADRRYLKYAVVANISSLICYMRFLTLGTEQLSITWIAVVYCVSWFCFSRECFGMKR